MGVFTKKTQKSNRLLAKNRDVLLQQRELNQTLIYLICILGRRHHQHTTSHCSKKQSCKVAYHKHYRLPVHLANLKGVKFQLNAVLCTAYKRPRAPRYKTLDKKNRHSLQATNKSPRNQYLHNSFVARVWRYRLGGRIREARQPL